VAGPRPPLAATAPGSPRPGRRSSRNPPSPVWSFQLGELLQQLLDGMGAYATEGLINRDWRRTWSTGRRSICCYSGLVALNRPRSSSSSSTGPIEGTIPYSSRLTRRTAASKPQLGVDGVKVAHGGILNGPVSSSKSLVERSTSWCSAAGAVAGSSFKNAPWAATQKGGYIAA
jgi:hypothetical protein